jgi:hypothetical protein
MYNKMANRIKYTEKLLTEVVSKSRYLKEVMENLGIIVGGGNWATVNSKIELWNIDTSHFLTKGEAIALKKKPGKLTAKDLLVENCKHSRNRAKALIYEENLLPIKCLECNQQEIWRGKKFSLILDHINGINNDNRIENLRLLCPNCNATLDTHCSKNRKSYEKRKTKTT